MLRFLSRPFRILASLGANPCWQYNITWSDVPPGYAQPNLSMRRLCEGCWEYRLPTAEEEDEYVRSEAW
ncbi:hypothetical protein NCHU2750_16360 [Neorhizobium sp. NCHU2750]|nr:hypothetical protein NCHU2750_16360 [Neorhizobium sp. NCHU2750]